MPRPEVLFLAHRIPFPPEKGDKIRSFRILERLAERYDVHLAAFVDDPADLAHREALRAWTVSATLVPVDPHAARLRSLAALAGRAPLSFAYFRDRQMRACVEAVRRRPLIAETAFSAAMTPYIADPVPGRPRLVDLCDADSAKFAAYGETTRGPMGRVYALESRRLAAAEAEILNWADAAFAVSEAEAAILSALPGARRPAQWFANGVDVARFDPDAADAPGLPAGEPPPDVVFTGAMDYRPNVEACLAFLRDVWPAVRQARPEARFAIVGANPARALRAADGRDGVRVTGRVPDVRPWLFAAPVAVAPLQIARGVLNKVLEAMAARRAVVATPQAALGLDVAAGSELLIRETPRDFADAVIALLDNPVEAARLGAAARARVAGDYGWRARLDPFDRALDAALGGPVAPSTSRAA